MAPKKQKMAPKKQQNNTSSSFVKKNVSNKLVNTLVFMRHHLSSGWFYLNVHVFIRAVLVAAAEGAHCQGKLQHHR